MKNNFLLVGLFLSLFAVNAAFAADVAPGDDTPKRSATEKSNEITTLQEEMVVVATGLNGLLRIRLELIASMLPQAQKQYADLALAKLAEAEEGVRVAKNMLALMKAQVDLEQKKAMIEMVSKTMKNVASLHKEIDALMEDLLEKLEFMPSGEPKEDGGRARA